MLLVRALLLAGEGDRAVEAASRLLAGARASTVALHLSVVSRGAPSLWMGEDPESGTAFPPSLSMPDVVALVGRTLLATGDGASAARSLSAVIQVGGLHEGAARSLVVPCGCVNEFRPWLLSSFGACARPMTATWTPCCSTGSYAWLGETQPLPCTSF